MGKASVALGSTAWGRVGVCPVSPVLWSLIGAEGMNKDPDALWHSLGWPQSDRSLQKVSQVLGPAQDAGREARFTVPDLSP